MKWASINEQKIGESDRGKVVKIIYTNINNVTGPYDHVQ